MATDEKKRLGRKAVTLISGNQRIFIDGGTTHVELVRALPLEMRLTIITHSPTIAEAMEPHHSIDVILIGGQLFRHSMVAIGAAAFEQIQRLNIDLAFIGLTGFHPKEGGTTGDYEEAAIKRAVIARSAETVALVTSEKIGAVSAYRVCAAKELVSIVVPQNADLKVLSKAGIKLIRA